MSLAGLCLIAPKARAQEPDMEALGAMEDYMNQYGEAAIQRAADTLQPRVSPAAVVFTPTTSHVTLRLTNPLDTAVTLELALRQTLPQPDTAGLLALDSLAPAALHAQDLTSWVPGVPARLTLAAHATDTLALSVTPPAGVAAGEYWTTLTVVAPRVTVHTVLPYEGHAIPVTGPIPFRLVTRVPLVYRQGPTTAGLTLGTPTATVAGDSVVRVCVPVQHTGVAGVPLRLTAAAGAGTQAARTSVPVLVHADVTPCVPVSVVALAPGQHQAELEVTVDSQPATLLPTFSAPVAPVRTHVAFTIPAAARAARRLARARDTVTNLHDSVFTTVLLEPRMGGALMAALAREVHKAVKQGRTPVLDVGATWCGPCHVLNRLWRQPGMRATVRGMYIIRIDGDVWGDQLGELGLDGNAFPVLMRLGRDGHPVGAPKYGVGMAIAPGTAQPGEAIYDVIARQVAAELAPFFKQARTDFAKHG